MELTPERIQEVAAFAREVNSNMKLFGESLAHSKKEAYLEFIINVDVLGGLTEEQFATEKPYARYFETIGQHMDAYRLQETSEPNGDDPTTPNGDDDPPPDNDIMAAIAGLGTQVKALADLLEETEGGEED